MADEPRSGAMPVICETHKIAMVRELQHVGDGKAEYGKPYCPLCREIEATKAKQGEAPHAAQDATKAPPSPSSQKAVGA